MSLEKLAEISRLYGADPDYVIAGGGNTSFKDKGYLYIKASGASLAQAKPADFVKMDRVRLAGIWEKEYPADPDSREAAVLADMMASRCAGEEAKRPSVETLLHDLLPFSFVVHTHPALVNGLGCSQKGKEAAAELFPQAIWIPSINPGYILSRTVKEALENQITFSTRTHVVIILQNHGIFAAANTTEEINGIYKEVMDSLSGRIKQNPDFSGAVSSFGNSDALGLEIKSLAGKIDPNGSWFVKFERNSQSIAFLANEAAFYPVSSAFTPDHIVYSGSDPLFLSEKSDMEKTFMDHIKKTGGIPRIVAVQSLGVFGLGKTEKIAENALDLFKDTQKVAVYSANFGGPRFMSGDQIHFINNWEVERYRTKVASS